MTPEQIAEVTRVVKEAVREEAILGSPRCPHEFAPPTAVDSEELLVSALLNRHLAVAELAPLVGADFFVPLHREIVRVLAALPDGADVVEFVVGAVPSVGNLEQVVTELRDGVPALLKKYAPEHIARVHDAARRRRISAWLSDLNLDIRMGRLTADEALAKLGAAAARARRVA